MNDAIRNAAKAKGVRLWQIAEKLGMNDGNFSRKLRRELSEEEQRRILKIIKELSEREGGDLNAEDANDRPGRGMDEGERS